MQKHFRQQRSRLSIEPSSNASVSSLDDLALRSFVRRSGSLLRGLLPRRELRARRPGFAFEPVLPGPELIIHPDLDDVYRAIADVEGIVDEEAGRPCRDSKAGVIQFYIIVFELSPTGYPKKPTRHPHRRPSRRCWCFRPRKTMRPSSRW